MPKKSIKTTPKAPRGGTKWPFIVAAAKHLGVSRPTLSEALNGNADFTAPERQKELVKGYKAFVKAEKAKLETKTGE